MTKPEPVSLEDLLDDTSSLGHEGRKREREMARRLKVLAERHQPLPIQRPSTAYSRKVRECACGLPHPCPDYVILNGGEVPK